MKLVEIPEKVTYISEFKGGNETKEVIEEANHEHFFGRLAFQFREDFQNNGFWVALLFSAFLTFAGAVIGGKLPENENISMGEELDCSRSPSTEADLLALRQLILFDNHTKNSVWGSALMLAASLSFPLLPLMLTNKDSSGGRDALAAQLMGQSASFGASEIVRGLAFTPDRTFWARCNLTKEECQNFGIGSIWLRDFQNSDVFADGPSLCGCPSESEFIELFDSLHSLPDLVSAMAGSALVAFAFGSIRALSSNPSCPGTTRSSIVCLLLLALFGFCLLGQLYTESWARSEVNNLVSSFLCGAGLQLFASFAYKTNSMSVART